MGASAELCLLEHTLALRRRRTLLGIRRNRGSLGLLCFFAPMVTRLRGRVLLGVLRPVGRLGFLRRRGRLQVFFHPWRSGLRYLLRRFGLGEFFELDVFNLFLAGAFHRGARASREVLPSPLDLLDGEVSAPFRLKGHPVDSVNHVKFDRQGLS